MTESRTIADSLKGTLLFGSLPDAERQTIAREMRETRYDAGQMIFARGDVGGDVYMVIEGRVRLSVLSGDGRELSLTHATDGAVFGEIAALDGGPRTADATAVTKTRMALLGQAALHRLLARSPELAEAILRLLCGRVRDADHQLESIALYPIEIRLARFLLSMIAGRNPGSDTDKVRIELGMSQNELALLLGASRPKVNAALAVLEHEGAVRRIDKELECDRERLEDMAGALS